MGEGLKRVAKMYGGITTISKDGKVNHLKVKPTLAERRKEMDKPKIYLTKLIDKHIQATVVKEDETAYIHQKPFSVALQHALIDVENTIEVLLEVYGKERLEYFKAVRDRLKGLISGEVKESDK